MEQRRSGRRHTILSDITQTAIRRHLAVPAAGIANTSFTLGIQLYDFMQAPERQAGTLQSRMDNLTPVEESYLTGMPVAQVALTGIAAPGATLSVIVTPPNLIPLPLGSHTLSPAEQASPSALLAFAAAMVNAINNGAEAYVAAMGPNSPGSFAVAPSASFSIAALKNETFTVSLAASGVGAYPSMQGVVVAMRAVINKVPVSGLVPILDALEAMIANSGTFAAFTKADVIGFDPMEDVKRQRVYERMRRRLAEFLGLPGDPLGLFRSGSGAIA